MIATVPVALAGRAYEVAIGPGLLASAGARIRPLLAGRIAAVVTDEIVADLHLPALTQSLQAAGIVARPVVLPPGEGQKSFAGLERLCDALLALGLERSDLVVALGGGVIGDLAGFAAAILLRGIDFVQVPTTLLAQVDSSVGGKTAIDSPRGKNLIGAFHQPRLVLADLETLATLPERERACGYAEVLKIALLGDAAFFDWLAANGPAVLAGQPGPLAHAVRRAVEMKAQIVAADEREAGVRALLNLGHTFGHALEAKTGFSEALKHGEAVGLGCALAFRFAESLGACPADDATRAVAAIAAAGLPTRLAAAGGPFSAAALIDHMRHDKKARGGGITLVLPRRIGEAALAHDSDPAALARFLRREGAAP